MYYNLAVGHRAAFCAWIGKGLRGFLPQGAEGEKEGLMNGKGESLRRCWVKVGLMALLAMMLLVTLVGCERPKRSKSSGLSTLTPAATSVVSQATISASPTIIGTAEETGTPGIEPPSPTVVSAQTTPAPSPAPTNTPVSAGPLTYVVQTGDNLYSIAQHYNMTVDELMALNDITDPASLQVGQVLKIAPGEAAATPTTSDQEIVHVVQRGENLFRIALKYGTTVGAIASRNGIVNPSLVRIGQKLFIPAGTSPPSPSGNVHVVQRGENLYRISLRYGTTVQAIMQANNLSSTIIYVGQRLRIP
jgi:LysM repeat protein